MVAGGWGLTLMGFFHGVKVFPNERVMVAQPCEFTKTY